MPDAALQIKEEGCRLGDGGCGMESFSGREALPFQ